MIAPLNRSDFVIGASDVDVISKMVRSSIEISLNSTRHTGCGQPPELA